MTYIDTKNREDYTATSGQTVFAYTFRILANTDLKVYKAGVLQTLTTHYTVSGAGDAGGGNVTFGTGVTLDDKVIIIRQTGDDQAADYTVGGIFPAETHEHALDKRAMRGQDLAEEIGRCIKFAITSALKDIAMPEGSSATDRASKVLAWNSAGTGLQLLAATIIDAVSVIAVKGDIVQGNASGAAAKLAIGANGDVPYVATDLLAYDKPWSVAWKKGADLASTAALTLGDDGNYFDVTGTAAITSIVANDIGKIFRLHFDAALTLTHHATDLVLPNGDNITTIAGDEATFIAYASGAVRMVSWVGHVLEHTHGSAAQGGAVVFPSGSIRQVVNTQSGALATTTTIMPGLNDDTIPQITEGGLFMTRTITPKSATNNLKIDVVFNGCEDINVSNVMTSALFQDSIANALAAGQHELQNNLDLANQIIFTHFMVAGTVAEITFTVRAGMDAAGTFNFNGGYGGRQLGGVLASSITITEIQT